MKIIIDLELSPFQKRIVRVAILAGAVVGALGLGLAVAAPKHTFATGNTLSASDMNENFTDLDTRLTTVEKARPVFTNPNTGKTYSLTGTFCGDTAKKDGAQVGGYTGAKTLCEAACGNSPTAHLCTGDEVVRYLQTGGVDAGASVVWYASGKFSPYTNGPTSYLDDCSGWTSNSVARQGATLNLGSMNSELCSIPNPLMCCD